MVPQAWLPQAVNLLTLVEPICTLQRCILNQWTTGNPSTKLLKHNFEIVIKSSGGNSSTDYRICIPELLFQHKKMIYLRNLSGLSYISIFESSIFLLENRVCLAQVYKNIYWWNPVSSSTFLVHVLLVSGNTNK